MIFSSSTVIGSMITEKLVNECSGSRCRVLVYRNAQPTVASYISDWDTKYKYFGTSYVSDPSFNGTELLAVYGGDYSGQWGSGTNPVALVNSINAVTMDGTVGVPTKTYVKDGTAAWAAVFFDEGFSFSYSTSANNFKDTAFMIVPVSASGGTGVVRLASTTITASLPDITDLYLSFAIPGAV